MYYFKSCCALVIEIILSLSNATINEFEKPLLLASFNFIRAFLYVEVSL